MLKNSGGGHQQAKHGGEPCFRDKGPPADRCRRLWALLGTRGELQHLFANHDLVAVF
jgi:hypothetical protein